MQQAISFNRYDLLIIRGNYCKDENRISLTLADADPTSASPYTTISLHIPTVKLEKDEIIVKNYGENQGMIRRLISQGVVKAPHRYVIWKDKILPVCRVVQDHENS